LIDCPEWIDLNVNPTAADLCVLPFVAVDGARAYFAACARTNGARERTPWTVRKDTANVSPIDFNRDLNGTCRVGI
jgi:hypothetical protein